MENIEILSNKYGIEKKYIKNILKNYGSVDVFLLLYYSHKLDAYGIDLSKKIMSRVIDIDCSEDSLRYGRVIYEAFKDELNENAEVIFYSSDALKRVLDNHVKKNIIELFLPKDENVFNSIKTVSDHVNHELHMHISQKSLLACRLILLDIFTHPINMNKYIYGNSIVEKGYTKEEMKVICDIMNYLRLSPLAFKRKTYENIDNNEMNGITSKVEKLKGIRENCIVRNYINSAVINYNEDKKIK